MDNKQLKEFLKLYMMSNGGELPTNSIPSISALLPALPILQRSVSGIQSEIARQRRDNNPLPMMSKGGKLREYNYGGKHELGGIPVDNAGNPTNRSNAVAEIERGETKHKDYIYSDRLPTKSNSYADQSKRIAKKFKSEDDITMSTKEFMLSRLRKANDESRANQEQMRYGGKLKEYNWGGQLPIAPQLVSFGDPTEMLTPQINQPNLPEITTSPILQNRSLRSNINNAVNQVGARLNAGPSNYNNLALGLKGAALTQGLVDSLSKPEIERSQFNRATPEVRSIAEQSRIDGSPILSSIDLGTNTAIANTRNVASSSLLSNVLANAAINKGNRAKAETSANIANSNAQLRMNEANLKAQLGAADAAERIRVQTANSQNQAAARGFDRSLASNLSQIGTTFNQHQYKLDQAVNVAELSKLKNNEIMAYLKLRYPGFSISDNLVQLIKEGKITNIDDAVKAN